MAYPDPKTRFNRKYSQLFYGKHVLLKSKTDRDVIRHYTIQIANHQSPNNIGGSVTCLGDRFKKIRFVTDWVILYEVQGNLIEFVTFYRQK